jgi:MFS family permease
LFDWRSQVGSGMTLVAAFSIATCSFAVYGPLILTSLHGLTPLATGYIIASESLAWSILSILVANAPPHRERAIIFGGAAMIALGLAGFAYAIPVGSIGLIVVCALLQGGGFGIAWPFATRVIVEAAKPQERAIAAAAVPTMQRLGYAIGAAIAGMIANVSGFSGGFTREAAQAVSSVLFLAFVPLALLGVGASVRLTRGSGVGRKDEMTPAAH